MRYSLLSRFQGALLGAALGEELGAYCWAQRSHEKQASGRNEIIARITPHQWRPGFEPKLGSPIPSSSMGKLAVLCAQELIRSGGCGEFALRELKTLLSDKADTLSISEVGRSSNNAAIGIGAIVPLALFLHDDEMKQCQLLHRLYDDDQEQQSLEPVALAFSYVVAQALKERLDSKNLLPNTIAYLQQVSTNSSAQLISALEQAHSLLQQGTSLHRAVGQFQTDSSNQGASLITVWANAIALALYCFLSTPNDVRLATLRAAQVGDFPPLTSTLTAALAGAYNSLMGLPLSWRTNNSSILITWESSSTKICQLATQLFAQWSGILDAAEFTDTMPAIATPDIIRPR